MKQLIKITMSKSKERISSILGADPGRDQRIASLAIDFGLCLNLKPPLEPVLDPLDFSLLLQDQIGNPSELGEFRFFIILLDLVILAYDPQTIIPEEKMYENHIWLCRVWQNLSQEMPLSQMLFCEFALRLLNED